MLTLDRHASTLVLIDYQSRLWPAIADNLAVLAHAQRLKQAAELLNIPTVWTEQNVAGLGSTIPELASENSINVYHKMTFDACRSGGFLERVTEHHTAVVAGCEAHVCVQQTVLGLLNSGRKVALVRDAVGSRTAESKETAINRMQRYGADIITTEMAVFEWLETAEASEFRSALDIVR